jgi:Holliday junction resolvase RusA-like endonuclease
MSTIELAIHSTDLLTSNQRLHFHAKAEKTALLRYRANLAATAAKVPTYDRAHVTVWVSWPDRRRRDRLNLVDTTKACFDGFTDAGVWPDDDDLHIIGETFYTTAALSGAKGVTRLRFEIEAAS